MDDLVRHTSLMSDLKREPESRVWEILREAGPTHDGRRPPPTHTHTSCLMKPELTAHSAYYQGFQSTNTNIKPLRSFSHIELYNHAPGTHSTKTYGTDYITYLF